MESEQKIHAEKITKPIQLLAAWLIGLIVINSSFLLAAKTIEKPEWVTGVLVIAAIINVPVFLISIFLLQTKFRPEMQEDTFYSKYLETKTGTMLSTVIPPQTSQSSSMKLHMSSGLGSHDFPNDNSHKDVNSLDWTDYKIRVNKLIPDAAKIKKQLILNNIPIHDTFGNKEYELPTPPIVLIGPGFTKQHIKILLTAIEMIEIRCVAFAESEHGIIDYVNEVLIGSYTTEFVGLTLNDALELINSSTELATFYTALKS